MAIAPCRRFTPLCRPARLRRPPGRRAPRSLGRRQRLHPRQAALLRFRLLPRRNQDPASRRRPCRLGHRFQLRYRCQPRRRFRRPCRRPFRPRCRRRSRPQCPGRARKTRSSVKGVPLGTDASFAVLAGSTVTSGGPTIVTGDLGVSPGTAVSGFGPGTGTVAGTIHAGDATAAQAQVDLLTAYNNAASRANPAAVPADIGGLVLPPGVYKPPVSLAITGNVTLDGLSNPNSVFIFQVASSTLTTAPGSSVTSSTAPTPATSSGKSELPRPSTRTQSSTGRSWLRHRSRSARAQA